VKKITVQIVIHIAAWLCFLMLPFAFYPRPSQMDAAFFTERYFNPYFIVNTVFIIAFYYCNAYLFVPRLLDRRNFVFYTALILGLMIIYGLMPRIYHALFGSLNINPNPPLAGNRPPGPPRSRPILSANNIVLFLLVFVFSTGIKVINQWLRTEQRNKEIANEKLKA
jgi:hypothetical protein